MSLSSRVANCSKLRTIICAPYARSVRLASWLSWKTKEKEPVEDNKQIDSAHTTTKRKFVSPRNPRTGKPRAGSNWNYAAELSALAQRIGHSVESLPSLQVALTDRRLLRNVPTSSEEKPVEYTRLAVLGRSALMFYVHEHLYFSFPQLEGIMLLDLSGHITKNDALCQLADHLGLVDLIKTRRVLEDPSNLTFIADVLCSVVGAVYENQGPKAARSFVHRFVISQLNGKDIHELIKLEHPRFMLYTILKSQGLPRPQSRLLKESGRATHFPTFQVGVYAGERLLGEGHGTSIKRAEREAMVCALVTQFKSQLTTAPLLSDNDPGYVSEEQLGTDTEVV